MVVLPPPPSPGSQAAFRWPFYRAAARIFSLSHPTAPREWGRRDRGIQGRYALRNAKKWVLRRHFGIPRSENASSLWLLAPGVLEARTGLLDQLALLRGSRIATRLPGRPRVPSGWDLWCPAVWMGADHQCLQVLAAGRSPHLALGLTAGSGDDPCSWIECGPGKPARTSP